MVALSMSAAVVLLPNRQPQQAPDDAELEPTAETPGSESDQPDVVAPGIGDPLSATELEDLAFYAKQENLDVEDVIRRLGASRALSILNGQLIDEYPAEYAGAGIEKDGSIWIAWRGSAPEAALGAIKAFSEAPSVIPAGNGVVQTVEHRGFSYLELDRRSRELHGALQAHPLVEAAATAADLRTGQINATVAVPKSASTAAVADAIRSGIALSDVNLEFVVDPIRGGDATHYGGEHMSTCTSGFSVIHGDGTRGTATAGHCGDAQTMDGEDLSFMGGHEGLHGDMQWHTKGTQPDDFYAGSASALEVNLRDVSGTMQTPADGALVCLNGKTSFRHCDEVYATSGVCDFDNVCNLIAMEEDLAEPGDSGGPWHNGNTAYGLHQGPVPYSGTYRDCYTRVNRLDEGLGVYVLTS